MKVAVIGSGGREHALVWKIAQSPKVTKVYALPGNAGIANLAGCVPIKADDISGVVDFCKREAIDLVVIGPEAPLSKGLADTLKEHKIPAVGPDSKAARLESSKVWAKDFMIRHGIPTAKYRSVSNKSDLLKAVDEFGLPIVIKMDGLFAGKGVFICKNMDEVNSACEAIYGVVSGETVVVEEFLLGVEASYMVFTDGETFIPLATSRDHKKIYDGEKGPNTGGMGAVSPAPISKDVEETAKAFVIEPLLKGMREENLRYNGVIYAGLMILPDGRVRVLEFNARLGDPETQSILFRMESDIMDILEPLGKYRKLPKNYEVKWSTKVACCVVITENGYPGDYRTGAEISSLSKGLSFSKGEYIFHAGTALKDGKFIVNGGRVLGVTALGTDINEARSKAYGLAEKASWSSAYYRKDIGVWS
jgi:phosphoribosylamine---glycine ligase